jgi:lysine/ornithine N-monooxygenase
MAHSAVPVAIVGAGPYGLAATAFLRAAGVETRLFGEPMGFWRHQMPAGMRLRSAWEASHIADPAGALTLEAYQAAHGVRLAVPLPLSDFVQYGLWYQRQVAPDVDRRQVVEVAPAAGGYRLRLEDGEVLPARRVVLATGIARFAWRPPQFEGLPPALVSHTAEHADLSRFAGQRVLVVGGGQSALESAALLHEAGAAVEVVVRARRVHWLHRGRLQGWLGPLRPLLYPPTDVGPPGLNWIVALPPLFRRLPRPLQQRIARRAIRPAGADWLRPRLRDVALTMGRQVVAVRPCGTGLRVALDDGSERRVEHLLLATGYRVDVARLPYLAPALVQALAQRDGYPQLGAGFEASLPGLHFLGALAAESFGPLFRFVAGTGYAARALVRHLGAHVPQAAPAARRAAEPA